MSKLYSAVKENAEDKGRKKITSWVKLGLQSIKWAAISGAFILISWLLMFFVKDSMLKACVVLVCSFSTVSSLLITFSIVCFIIAKIKWCKKMEGNIETILQNTNKQ